MTSTKLIRRITSPIDLRLQQAELDVLTLKNTTLATGDNVSELVNDAAYQNATQVDAKIAQVVGAAPEALNTLQEIAAKLATEDSAIAALVAQDTANATAVTALQTVNATQDVAIAKLMLQFATEKRTVTANFNLLDTDAGTLQLVVNNASPITVDLTNTTQNDKRFLLINDAVSTTSIICNGVSIPPGDQHAIVRIAGNWIEI